MFHISVVPISLERLGVPSTCLAAYLDIILLVFVSIFTPSNVQCCEGVVLRKMYPRLSVNYFRPKSEESAVVLCLARRYDSTSIRMSPNNQT